MSWHKDTNFKANHNIFTIMYSILLDVCLGTKIRILKQITTDFDVKLFAPQDVCLGTKIRILKQITTLVGLDIRKE